MMGVEKEGMYWGRCDGLEFGGVWMEDWNGGCIWDGTIGYGWRIVVRRVL